MTGFKEITSADAIATIRNIGSSVRKRTGKTNEFSRQPCHNAGPQNIRFIKFEGADINFAAKSVKDAKPAAI
jgi:hypothetical protein